MRAEQRGVVHGLGSPACPSERLGTSGGLALPI